MIIGLFGDLRSGKTLTAVKEVYKLYKKGYVVYSNIHLNFPHRRYVLKDLENVVKEGKPLGNKGEDIVILTDEYHVNFGDSRQSMTAKNRVISYLLLMSSKLGNDKDKHREIGLIWFYTSQYPDLVDKRLRKPTVLTGFCEKYNMNDKRIISVEWHQIKNGHEIILKELFFAHHYYHLYDTREVVKLEHSSFEEET